MTNPEKLLFIVGAPRSGTTWLQLMLAQYENVVSAQETHLFSSYMASLFSSESHFNANDRAVGLSRIMPKDRFLNLCKQFADAAIAELSQTKPNAEIFLEKTPRHIDYCEQILRIYPNAYFIELVRDPRAMVASMRAVKWGTWANPGIVTNTEIWKRAIRNGRNLETLTKRHIRIRYEDLLEDTESTLRKAINLVGEPPSDEQLRDWVSQTSIEKLKRDKGSVEAPWDMKKEPEGFYRKGRADSWRDELSHGQIKLIEQMAQHEMTHLGYEPTTRGTSVPWRLWLEKALSETVRRLQWYRKKI